MSALPRRLRASLLVLACTLPAAHADDVQEITQDNMTQQQRIRDGVRSGELSGQEAARLQAGEAALHRAQARALQDGQLSDAEKDRLNHAQERLSDRIHQEKTDRQEGNPDADASRFMEAAAQRNAEQQRQIERGIDRGELTNREVGRAQRSEAVIQQREVRAAHEGSLGRDDRRQLQRADRQQDRQLRRDLHDDQER